MKREVFIAYANSVAEQFHMSMEDMLRKQRNERM